VTLSALPFVHVAISSDRRRVETDRRGDDDEADAVSAGVWCESGSARAAIRSAIETSVDQLESELPRARLGEDPEGVHQARVATRRLRSDLRTFGLLLDDDWRVGIRAELKRLADALGAVRDPDVLGVRLQAAIDSTQVDGKAAARVLAALGPQAGAAREALVAVLDDERTETLLSNLRVAVVDPPTTLSAVGSADLRLRPLVRRPWRKLARAVAKLADEPRAVDLHRIRLLAKRSRYAAEAVGGVYGRDARRFAKAITGIQEVLGDMNDADVAVAWLRRNAVALDPAAAFVSGELAHHFGLVADAHRHGWEESFERARKCSDWLH
jgi:CHAD domain-containing protein